MIDQRELGALFSGLRAGVTVADEEGRIIFLNDRAVAHYGAHGGKQLVGTNLYDCHNPGSQAKIRELYSRYRAGDLTPTRYHKNKGDSIAQSIVYIPIVYEEQFRGVAELMWVERQELVCEV